MNTSVSVSALSYSVTPSTNASDSISFRGLEYNVFIDPTPSRDGQDDVDEWWRNVVYLFKRRQRRGCFDDNDWSWALEEKEEIMALTCPQNLKDVMMSQYKKEAHFNAALFAALREGLANDGVALLRKEPVVQQQKRPNKSKEMSKSNNANMTEEEEEEESKAGDSETKFSNEKVEADPAPILFANAITESFAIGIKRNVNGEQKDGTTRSKADQGACLFEKDNGKWKVVDCLSIVALKMKDCKVFEENSDGQAISDALGESFRSRAAIAQVMLYTMGYVVPSLAKIGQLGDSVPWAILIGNKDPPPKSVPKLNRWVSGEIFVPRDCGGNFQYAVTGFEEFETNMSVEAVNRSLCVYLETFFKGLLAARRWLKNVASGQSICPLPASGKDVMIGTTKLEGLTLCGGPCLRVGFPWKLSQGEMFAGSLDLSKLPTNQSRLITFFSLDNNNVDKVVDVAVKVCSMAVHKYLTPIDTAYLVLKNIKMAMELFLSTNNKGPRPPDLSDVLLAVHARNVGLITIMVDLSKQGFRLLEPVKRGRLDEKNAHWRHVTLAHLWCAFLELVQTTLIPLANLNIIHPDIRPGVDETSNVLVNLDEANGHSRVTMKLIDYESLKKGNIRNTSSGADFRYVRLKGVWTAPQYLWWQCVLVAYAWKFNMKQRDMSETNVQLMLTKDLKSRRLANKQRKDGFEMAKEDGIVELQTGGERDWLDWFGTEELMTTELASKLVGLF